MATVRLDLSKIQNALTKLEKVSKRSVKIGILADAQYGNGTKVTDVANILENGWVQKVTPKQSTFLRYHGLNVPSNSTLNCPPRPFFSNTVKNKSEQWIKLGERYFIANFSVENADNAVINGLTAIGTKAVADIQDTLYDNDGIAPRSEATLQMYSFAEANAEGDSGTGRKQSLYKSGTLFNAITFELI